MCRYLGKLKKTVRNKARVEGSIANAYLVEECSNFCSYYFESHIRTRQRAPPRNHDGQSNNIEGEHPEILDVFKYAGRPFGHNKIRILDSDEHAAAHLYVLNNCEEVAGPIMSSLVDELRREYPLMSEVEIQQKVDKDFPRWFKLYVENPANNVSNSYLRALAQGPLLKARVYSAFYVNGFKFHTLEHGSRRLTNNTGVCIKGSTSGSMEFDFYGRLQEVIELEYPVADRIKRITLFKCEWFDPSPAGTHVHPRFKLVSINHTRRYSKYEPFVLAKQASQVYFCTYPSKKSAKKDWWAVCKIKSRPIVEVPEISTIPPPYQDDEHESYHLSPVIDDIEITHPDGGLIAIGGGNEDDEDESTEIEISSDDEDIESLDDEEKEI